MDFLKKAEPHGVYAAAIRCLVWSRVSLGRDTRIAALRDFTFLLQSMRRTGPGRGCFAYMPGTPAQPDLIYDNSVSQLAVLGLQSLNRRGFEIPENDWRLIDTAWRAHQNADGSWPYFEKAANNWNLPTFSMTAAGVATLLVTNSCLTQSPACVPQSPDTSTSAGMQWLGNSFDATYGRHGEIYTYNEPYALFALSRVGATSGRKVIGGVDWYQKCGEFLCNHQDSDGSWDAWFGRIAGTSFGSLCLTYGRAPVVVNKLEYETDPARSKQKTVPPAYWNLRPLDLANFSGWIGDALENAAQFGRSCDFPILCPAICTMRRCCISREIVRCIFPPRDSGSSVNLSKKGA